MVDIQQCPLGALQENVLAVVQGFVQEDFSWPDVLAQTLAPVQAALVEVVQRNRVSIIDFRDYGVLLFNHALQPWQKDVLSGRLKQIPDTDTHTGHLVNVRRANAFTGSAYGIGASGTLL